MKTEKQEVLKQLIENPLIEEILNPDELKHLVDTNTPLKHYIGFEISGNPHLGTGIITMAVIKSLLELDAEIIIFLADWHSWINHKLGGDRKFIYEVAEKVFKHFMIASALAVGVNPDKLKFIHGSDLYRERPDHWGNLIEASQHLSLSRIKRSISIMGRHEGDIVEFAQLIYPPLQVADIFTMQRNIAHAGTDQRKAHVIARQVAKKMTLMPLKDSNNNIIKPIAIHQKLLPGLSAPPKWPITAEEIKQLVTELKMSKSKPDGAIFINDKPDEIKKKIRKAFCPEGDLSYNPVMTWAKMLIFDRGDTLDIKRPEKWGGNLHFDTYKELEKVFEAKQLHPLDLKEAVAEYIINMLEPARKYLMENNEVQEMQEEIKKKISR